MIQPHTVCLAFAGPHDPAHLLDMGGERLGERPSRHADHHIGHIKTSGQDVGGNQPVYFAVRCGEVLNSIALEVIIFHVRDGDKVVSPLVELAHKVTPMLDTGGEHHSLARPAE